MKLDEFQPLKDQHEQKLPVTGTHKTCYFSLLEVFNSSKS